MMVWRLLLNMAIFCISVKFLGGYRGYLTLNKQVRPSPWVHGGLSKPSEPFFVIGFPQSVQFFSKPYIHIIYPFKKNNSRFFFFRTFRSLKRPAFFFNWLLNYQGCVWFAFHRIFWDDSANPPVGWLNDANKTPEVCALDQFAVPSAAAIFPEALEGVGVPQLDRSSRSWTMGVPWGGYGRGGWSVSFFF